MYLLLPENAQNSVSAMLILILGIMSFELCMCISVSLYSSLVTYGEI